MARSSVTRYKKVRFESFLTKRVGTVTEKDNEEENEKIFTTLTLDQESLRTSLERTRTFIKVQQPTPETSVPNIEKRFAVKNKLGEGAFGLVELLEDNHIGRNVARKSFKHTDQMAFLEYEREVHIVGRLDHPGIPMIFDVGVDKEHPYLLMKYVEGRTLRDIIMDLARGKKATHAKYPFVRRANIIKELSRVLIAAHNKGIVHRDIKPANIMVSDNGEVYLMDWGIAMDININDTEDTICGTPLYMPPEQVKGGPIKPYTDTFSLGMVFYHLMTLHPPRKIKPLNSMLRSIATEIPPSPDTRYHKSQGYNPSEYRSIIERAIALDPKNRYQSAIEMLEDLENVLNGNICGRCPRTVLKGYVYKYFAFVDKKAYSALGLSAIVLLIIVLLLVGLGVLLGSMI